MATPSAAAAGERATTRLAWSTTAGTSAAVPAATIGQSGQRTVTIRDGIAVTPRPCRSAPGAAPATGSAAGATVPSGPGNQSSARRGRGTRRPVAETVTRRPRRRPHPCSTPSHTGVDAAIVMSATSGPGSPMAISTASRACTRDCTRRMTAAFTRLGIRVMTTSKPSRTAATRSAHDRTRPDVRASRRSRSTRTSRSSGTPSSATASTPSQGTSTTASQAPATVASTARATASEVAAIPPHDTARPRGRPSGSSGISGSATGRVRWRARVVGATAAARSMPGVYERTFATSNGCS